VQAAAAGRLRAALAQAGAAGESAAGGPLALLAALGAAPGGLPSDSPWPDACDAAARADAGGRPAVRAARPDRDRAPGHGVRPAGVPAPPAAPGALQPGAPRDAHDQRLAPADGGSLEEQPGEGDLGELQRLLRAGGAGACGACGAPAEPGGRCLFCEA